MDWVGAENFEIQIDFVTRNREVMMFGSALNLLEFQEMTIPSLKHKSNED